MNTFIWINRQGEFLNVSEQTTHTGHHVRASFVKDVNYAFVGYSLPRFNDHTDITELTQVPAWAERKVFVGVRPVTEKV